MFGNRIDGYRNSKRMAIHGMMKRLCEEEDVGYVDLWDSFVGKEDMYARDGLHLSGRGQQFLPRDCQGRSPVAWVNTRFKLVGQGFFCQRRLTKYKKIAHAREYREAHTKKKLNVYA